MLRVVVNKFNTYGVLTIIVIFYILFRNLTNLVVKSYDVLFTNFRSSELLWGTIFISDDLSY